MRYKNLQCSVVPIPADETKSGRARFVASTSKPDRYGDVIDQRGWSLAAYKRNPVILLNHNANSLPIGRGSVDVVDGSLQVDIEFDMGDPIGSEVARKTEAGYMSAVSVGFNPIESTPRSQLPKEDPAHASKGMYFSRAELLEVSVVTIPANGDAVSIKNFLHQDRSFRLSELKHILDVDVREDTVIVTYARLQPEEPEEEPEEEPPLDEPEEEAAYEPKDDEDEDSTEEKNLTQNEREFLRYLIGE